MKQVWNDWRQHKKPSSSHKLVIRFKDVTNSDIEDVCPEELFIEQSGDEDLEDLPYSF